MQVFELHFNPRRASDSEKKSIENESVFESFCYEPENIYEKKLGNIYIVGEIKNFLPQNLKLLERASKVVKDRYYANYLKLPEGALKESLKALNDFFAEELKRDNTSWLGNLGLTVISLTSQEEPWVDLNFTKIGDSKILLLAEGRISDIGANLKQEIEPYPLKVFSNIISGKIANDSVIAVFTKETHDSFQNLNLIEKIAKEKQFSDKKIKDILRSDERELMKTSGVCLLIQALDEPEPKLVLDFQEKLAKFPSLAWWGAIRTKSSSLPRFARRAMKASLSSSLVSASRKLVFKKLKNFKIPKLTAPLPKIKIPKLNFPVKLVMPVLNKNLILIFLLVSVLASGFFFAQTEKKKEIKAAQDALSEIEKKINRAENFLILKNEENANVLFQEALAEILPLTKKTSPLPEKAASLKKEVEENLNNINKLEGVDDPKVVFEFNSESGLFPYKMALSESTLYFYNPLSPNVYKLEKGKESGTLFKGKENIQFGIPYSNSVLFFTKPNFTISLGNKGDFQETIVDLPDFSDLASIRSVNLVYFLESKTGEIIKYSPSSNKREIWLAGETKKAISAKSIAVDGSIWILTDNNQIDRYRQGILRETLKIGIFPPFKNPSKILTDSSLAYLYVLEPSQNRLVILNKQGKIVKQYRSKKFNNLLDVAVSADGKTIYLLNGEKVYQLF